jgi:hypothetical protein
VAELTPPQQLALLVRRRLASTVAHKRVAERAGEDTQAFRDAIDADQRYLEAIEAVE